MNNWEIYNFHGKAKYNEKAESLTGTLRGLIDRSISGTVEIPNGTATIGEAAFWSCSSLTSVIIPNSVTTIGNFSFRYCTNLANVEIHDDVTYIGDYAFHGCERLTSVEIPDSVLYIGTSAFQACVNLISVEIPNSTTTLYSTVFKNCYKLQSVNIPESVTSIYPTVFEDCRSLEFVTLGSDFNANNLNLSASTKFSVDTLVNMLTALADRTEQETYTLTLGSTNLAKLTDEQKAIAINKNWTLA